MTLSLSVNKVTIGLHLPVPQEIVNLIPLVAGVCVCLRARGAMSPSAGRLQVSRVPGVNAPPTSTLRGPPSMSPSCVVTTRGSPRRAPVPSPGAHGHRAEGVPRSPALCWWCALPAFSRGPPGSLCAGLTLLSCSREQLWMQEAACDDCRGPSRQPMTGQQSGGSFLRTGPPWSQGPVHGAHVSIMFQMHRTPRLPRRLVTRDV